jgi:excisionase family DNA binding protein
MTALPDPATEPTLRVERAGRLLGISRSSAYEAARSGQIPVLRFGRRLVVPTAALLELLKAGRQPATAREAPRQAIT